MGNYNPHRPTILGQEWAPVRESPYLLDTETERGVTFVLDTATTVVSGAVYIDSVPAALSGRGITMAVYEAGTEHLTGPIQRVVVPPVSGIYQLVESDSNFDLDPNEATIAQALTNSNDISYVTALGDINFFIMFDTSSVASQLSGKRILAVNFLYVLGGTQPGTTGSSGLPVRQDLYLRRNGAFGSLDSKLAYQGQPNINVSVTTAPTVDRSTLGNAYAIELLQVCSPLGTGATFFPWRPDNLDEFDLGTTLTSALGAYFTQTDGCSGCVATGSVVPRNNYTYVALEILYCEETRLLYGGKGYVACAPHTLVQGQNKVMLRPSDTFGAAGKLLQPGEYTVTVTEADFGQYANGIGGTYAMTALQELYSLPSHTGVVVDARIREGATFTRDTSDILPRITLHTSSGVVTGVHDYDTLAIGNVYEAVDVSPDVVMRSGGAAVAYPQVRFYARRFGGTNVALALTSLTQPTWTVKLSVDAMDALPEIVDGWREVTLRFPSSATPTFSDTGGTHIWVWSADGLEANNQWQVLVPYGASATSGAFDTSAATYGGATAFTTITGQTLNTDADATIIFSQDPPAVTGLAVEVLTQSLEPVGEECDLVPGCVPTGLYYHHLTWNAQDVLDEFEDRETTNGWEDADSGQTWSHVNGSIDDYYVTDGAGVQRVDTVSTIYFSIIDASAYNVEVRGRFRLPVLPTGAGITVRITGRLEDVNNYLEGELIFNTSGTVQLLIGNRVGGTGMVLSTIITLDGLHVAGDVWNIAMQLQADTALAKSWRDETPEPLAWQVNAPLLAGSLSVTGTQISVGVRAETGNLDTPFALEWLDVSATNMDMSGFELQRQDDVDDEWQTIMLSTGLAVREFNDYEARVGELSRYRMRTVNVLEFYGAWTASGAATSTLTVPGVTGAGTDGNSVLVFTTNERQSGESNLAYVMTWNGDVSEEFAFPESGNVQLRDVFQRDYPIAFRPTERGGERFSRDIIVQNAAVPSGLMRDGFRSLRDLAWDDVSYVCVRNELGDRWFAAVLVPSGKIQRNRRLYIARIDVVEVSSVPTAVDPTGS